jgi:uncharacterized RDD family membrane protein YckC
MDRYDTFWPRLGALLLDGIILSIVSFLIGLIPVINSKIGSASVSLVFSMLPYAYSILMLGRYGQTVGKMLLNVKVVDNKSEGKISYYQSFLREAVPVVLICLSKISSIIMFKGIDLMNYEFSVIGYIILFLPSYMLLIWSITEIITMLFNSRKRALHDIVAKTVVIRTD